MYKYTVAFNSDIPDETIEANEFVIGEEWASFGDGSGPITAIRTARIARINRINP